MSTRLRKLSNTWLQELLKDKHFETCINLGCRTDEDQEGRFYSDYFKWNKMIKIDIEMFPGVDIIAPAEKLPIPDDSVNFIFCNWVFYYLTNLDRIKAISEMTRVLKHGGEVLISYWSLNEIDMQFMRDLIKKNFCILNSWKLDCEAVLDKRDGKAEIIYGAKK